MGALIGICRDCFTSKEEGPGSQLHAKRSSQKGPSRVPSQRGKPSKQKSMSKQHLLSTDPSQGYSSTGSQSPPPGIGDRRPSWGRLPQSPGEPPRSPTLTKPPPPPPQRTPNEPKSRKSKMNRNISLRVGPDDPHPMRRSFKKRKK